jgi:peptidoglycan lytic transglycosylase D
MAATRVRGPKSIALAITMAVAAGCVQQPVTTDTVKSDSDKARKPRIEEKTKRNLAVKTRQNPQPEPTTQDPHVDLWWAISDNLAFASEVPDTQVARQLSWLEGNQRYFDNTLTRAELYLPYVLEKVLESELPAETALLPFIESAYNPFAYSPSGAAGLWQFIPSTADGFGLENNRWYEGRRDVVASTDAAIVYLSELNAMFDGDWLLTFAAYNAGPGTVRRAIEKNERRGQDTDFWSLDLPPVTQRYVPRLIALSKVIARSDEYQVELKPLTTEVPFSLVEIDRPIDLSTAAEIASISNDEIHQLNPGFTKWVTPPKGNHYLLLPTESVDTFQENLVDMPFREWQPHQEYVVKRGDTLSKIARQQGLTPADLAAINGIGTKDVIKAGQVLRFPHNPAGGSANKVISELREHKGEYRVKAGDSLWSIAKSHKVTVSDLMNWNQLTSGTVLKPGQTLKLATTSASKPSQYEVRQGDSLYTIAKQFNLALADLMAWNNLHRKEILQPGQRLKLYR